MKALAGIKFVGFDQQSPTRKALDKVFREYHVAPDYTMEFDNVETVKRAVEINSGVAIVPEATVLEEVANRTLAIVRIEDRDFARPLAAIHTRTKVLSPAMEQFIALLKAPLLAPDRDDTDAAPPAGPLRPTPAGWEARAVLRRPGPLSAGRLLKNS